MKNQINYLDLLKTIYTKEILVDPLDDIGICIGLTKTLSKDKDNLPALKKITPYLFYIPPEHYYYLLYFMIPRKLYVPRMIKIQKDKKTENKLLDRIQKILGWTNREMILNSEVLKTINDDKKFWKKEIGV